MRATVSEPVRPRSAAAVLYSPLLLATMPADPDELGVGGVLLRIAGVAVLGGLAIWAILRFSRRESDRLRGPLPVPLDGLPPPRQLVDRTWRADDAPLPVVLPEAPLPNQAADHPHHTQGDAEPPRAPDQECPVPPPRG